MKQSPLLIFKSHRFATTPGEDEQTNPGIFGEALAVWLSERLNEAGFPTDEVFAEDFGWCIPVRRQSRTVYVACASTDETAETWQVFAFADGGLLARLFRKKEVDPVASVVAAIRKCLQSEPSIRELREEASGS